MEGEIIRAYMLEPGDIFKLGSTVFKVQKIENDRVWYQYFYIECNEKKGAIESMGANSQERVILITNKTKQNEHQNRSGNFSKL